MDKLELVSNIDQVIKNISIFNECLHTDKHIPKKLSTYKHWYYDLEKNLFGPSKFIGYKNNNANDYYYGTLRENGEYEGYMDGRKTQPEYFGLTEPLVR